MKNVISGKMKFKKKKYILIENYWDVDPCDMCVFRESCDRGVFHGDLVSGCNPAEKCGTNPWIRAEDVHKLDV